MDVGCEARFERRLREMYKERMRTHEHRLAEWRRQQAARATLHTETTDTVCILDSATQPMFKLPSPLSCNAEGANGQASLTIGRKKMQHHRRVHAVFCGGEIGVALLLVLMMMTMMMMMIIIIMMLI